MIDLEFYQVLLLILLIVVIILAIVDIIVIAILFSLRKRIENRLRSINVLVAQKFDMILALASYLEENNVEIPEEIKSSLDLNTEYNLKYVTTTERYSIKTLLTKSSQTLTFLAEKSSISQSEKFHEFKVYMSDIDNQYRKSIVLYNSDVSGYNYWINFFLFRLFSKMFGLKTKDIIY